MDYQRMAEELTTQCVIKMQNDPNHSANHIYDAICTALQAAYEKGIAEGNKQAQNKTASLA